MYATILEKCINLWKSINLYMYVVFYIDEEAKIFYECELENACINRWIYECRICMHEETKIGFKSELNVVINTVSSWVFFCAFYVLHAP